MVGSVQCWNEVWPKNNDGLAESHYVYIYIIYSPNLGLEIAVPGREREQSRFRGSREGAGGSKKGARRSKGEHRRSTIR